MAAVITDNVASRKTPLSGRLFNPAILLVLGQGEVIEQQFGEPLAGFRTLDLYLSAVLEFQLEKSTRPEPEWR